MLADLGGSHDEQFQPEKKGWDRACLKALIHQRVACLWDAAGAELYEKYKMPGRPRHDAGLNKETLGRIIYRMARAEHHYVISYQTSLPFVGRKHMDSLCSFITNAALCKKQLGMYCLEHSKLVEAEELYLKCIDLAVEHGSDPLPCAENLLVMYQTFGEEEKYLHLQRRMIGIQEMQEKAARENKNKKKKQKPRVPSSTGSVQYHMNIANKMENLAGKRSCAACGAHGLNVKLNVCSRCHKTYYCSVECQRKDWPKHKDPCKKIAAEEADYEKFIKGQQQEYVQLVTNQFKDLPEPPRTQADEWLHKR